MLGTITLMTFLKMLLVDDSKVITKCKRHDAKCLSITCHPQHIWTVLIVIALFTKATQKVWDP